MCHCKSVLAGQAQQQYASGSESMGMYLVLSSYRQKTGSGKVKQYQRVIFDFLALVKLLIGV
jgi:hypothetical protein